MLKCSAFLLTFYNSFFHHPSFLFRHYTTILCALAHMESEVETVSFCFDIIPSRPFLYNPLGSKRSHKHTADKYTEICRGSPRRRPFLSHYRILPDIPGNPIRRQRECICLPPVPYSLPPYDILSYKLPPTSDSASLLF